MKSVIISDIHNRIDVADKILRKEQPDEAIFLGDYFDQFDDTASDAERVANWLKKRLHLKGYHFLMGNHETQYRWPKCPWHKTKAGSLDKQKAIDKVLDKNDWAKMLFAVERGNWWMTHAGLHPRLFVHAIKGFDPQRVWNKFHEAEFQCEAGLYTRVTDEQHHEGEEPSGPLWLRWNKFEPIPGINQIVGHTPQKEVASIIVESENPEERSINYNIDVRNRFYAILENGEVTIHGLN